MSDSALTAFDWSNLPHGYAAHYDELDVRYSNVYRASAARLAKLGGVRPGVSAIDIGAGTGISTQAIWTAMRHQGRMLAIDPSTKMLNRAIDKPELEGVVFRKGTAELLVDVANQAGFRNVDTILSNFTYYYMYEDRKQLHGAVRSLLRPGGRWSFNLTRYLGELTINGATYNEFSRIYVAQLVEVARHYGIRIVPNGEPLEQFADASWDLQLLAEAGFKNADVEAWALPLLPSDAYRFTIEGFYRYGSRVTFAPQLMEIPTEQRLKILVEALEECVQVIDAGPPPHVANYVAFRGRS